MIYRMATLDWQQRQERQVIKVIQVKQVRQVKQVSLYRVAMVKVQVLR